MLFYTQVVGLREVRDLRPRSVWLALGPDAVLMIEAREPGEPATLKGTMELFALAASPEEREAFRTRAITEGCFDGATEHTVYARDSDGRRVGLSSYPLVQPPA